MMVPATAADREAVERERQPEALLDEIRARAPRDDETVGTKHDEPYKRTADE